MKIWLDDIRQPPDHTWLWAPNPEEFYYLLDTAQHIEEISFDHDLGDRSNPEITGYTCLCWVEKRILHDASFSIPQMHVHTANASVFLKMQKVIDKLHSLRR